MEKMESPTPNKMRADDRKSRGNRDPQQLGITGGDPTADDRKGYGDRDLNRIVVTDSDPSADERKGHGDSNPDRIGVARGDPEFFVLQGRPTPNRQKSMKKAMISFTMLKDKIAKTPLLKHFDPDCPPVIVVYASKWAVSAALLQGHDGKYWPVTLTSLKLKPNGINYGLAKKRF